MSYRECAKKQTQCKGLKKGVKGYRSCVSDAGCTKAPRKSRAKTAKKTPPPIPPKRRPSKTSIMLARANQDVKERVKESAQKLTELTQLSKEGKLKKLTKSTSPLSKWQEHLREFRRLNPDIKGADVMREAKKTYNTSTKTIKPKEIKPKTTKPKTTKPRKKETLSEILKKNKNDRNKKGGLNEKVQKLLDKGINPYEKMFNNPDSITNALKGFSSRMGI